jgi:hypothetical protein
MKREVFNTNHHHHQPSQKRKKEEDHLPPKSINNSFSPLIDEERGIIDMFRSGKNITTTTTKPLVQNKLG